MLGKTKASFKQLCMFFATCLSCAPSTATSSGIICQANYDSLSVVLIVAKLVRLNKKFINTRATDNKRQQEATRGKNYLANTSIFCAFLPGPFTGSLPSPSRQLRKELFPK